MPESSSTSACTTTDRAASEREGETLQLTDDPEVPLLVRLPERPFEPVASLSADVVQAASGGTTAKRISVVRYAFSPFDVSMQPLTQVSAIQFRLGGVTHEWIPAFQSCNF